MNVDCLDANNIKHPLRRHAEVNQRLIHVEDEIPVTMRAIKGWMHEIHVVQCLGHDILGLALRYMRAHAIYKLIGTYESLCSAALGNKVLCIKLRGKRRCLYDEIEHLHSNSLLVLLENVPEQGVFEWLQLPERSSARCLPLAL